MGWDIHDSTCGYRFRPVSIADVYHIPKEPIRVKLFDVEFLYPVPLSNF